MQKFENVDILKSLNAIMQTHTKHYKSDFEIDKETLKQAAKSQNPADKKYLWLCRTSGTWCLRERDTFLKGSREHNTFCFYAEQTSDKILAYAVELTGIDRGKIKGNLYELDYQKHYQYVKDASLPVGTTKLVYENGERTQAAGQHISGEADLALGKFLHFEEQPKDPAALRGILWDEQYRRDHFDAGNIKEHIEKLSGKEQKPSLRKQLAKDKETVKTAPKKQAAKNKNKELEV